MSVIWMSDANASMTTVIFEDWFFNNFVPAVEREEHIPFKIHFKL